LVGRVSRGSPLWESGGSTRSDRDPPPKSDKLPSSSTVPSSYQQGHKAADRARNTSDGWRRGRATCERECGILCHSLSRQQRNCVAVNSGISLGLTVGTWIILNVPGGSHRSSRWANFLTLCTWFWPEPWAWTKCRGQSGVGS
jgi:hypothetical protein